jgi:hypothetical protein
MIVLELDFAFILSLVALEFGAFLEGKKLSSTATSVAGHGDSRFLLTSIYVS